MNYENLNEIKMDMNDRSSDLFDMCMSALAVIVERAGGDVSLSVEEMEGAKAVGINRDEMGNVTMQSVTPSGEQLS